MRTRTIIVTCSALLIAAGFAGGCGDDSSSDSSPKSSTKSESTSSDEHDSMTADEMDAHESATTDSEDDGAKGAADAEFKVTIVKGAVKGGPQSFKVQQGDKVKLVVTSDEANEVHVHGVDVARDIPAGGTATIAFTADEQGSYEIEIEETGVLIGTLEVR